MIRTSLCSALLLAAASSPSLALEVTRSVQVDASPQAVWQEIGGFCGIGDWHPAVQSCTLGKAHGRPQRTLALKGGGEIIEQQVARSNPKMDYTYIIVKSPLPVAHYRSTISVHPSGSGSKVTWWGKFAAAGAPDEKATEVVSGIYESGLKGLADKVKQ